VQIGDQAALSSDHKTANVVLMVTCTNATPTPIRVSVSQNRLSGSALSGKNYKCNRQAQRLVVPVTAGSGTFHTGVAQASVSLRFHSSTHVKNVTTTNNTSVNTSRTIQLV
jgi:hypothetical protein